MSRLQARIVLLKDIIIIFHLGYLHQLLLLHQTLPNCFVFGQELLSRSSVKLERMRRRSCLTVEASISDSSLNYCRWIATGPGGGDQESRSGCGKYHTPSPTRDTLHRHTAKRDNVRSSALRAFPSDVCRALRHWFWRKKNLHCEYQGIQTGCSMRALHSVQVHCKNTTVLAYLNLHNQVVNPY